MLNFQTAVGSFIPDVTLKRISIESVSSTQKSGDPHISKKNKVKSLSSKEMSIDLQLNLKDVFEKNNIAQSWFADQSFRKFIKIMVVQIRSEKLYDSLYFFQNDSAIPPNLIPEGFFNRFAKAAFIEQLIDPASDVRVVSVTNQWQLEESVTGNITPNLPELTSIYDDAGNKYYNLDFFVRFDNIDSDIQHLSYFYWSFIDLEALAEEFDEFAVSDFDSLFGWSPESSGRILSDVVFDGGKLKTDSVYYLLPDGSEWHGPKHKNAEGVFVTGKNSGESGQILTEQLSSVTKIQDFRGREYFDGYDFALFLNKIEDYVDTSNEVRLLEGGINDIVSFGFEPIISEVYTSQDQNAQISGYFAVNMSELIRSRFLIPTAIESFLPEIRKQVFDRTEIRSLRVEKTNIKEVSSIKTESEIGSVVVAEKADVNKHSFSTKTGSDRIKHFSFRDSSTKENVGNYVSYNVSIEVVDGTQEILKEIYEDILSSSAVLGQLYQLSTTPGAFSYKSNSFAQMFVEEKSAQFKESVVESVYGLVKFFSLISITQMQKNSFLENLVLVDLLTDPEKLVSSLLSMIDLKKTSPSLIGEYLQLLNKVTSNLENVLFMTPSNSTDSSLDYKNSNSPTPKRVITIEKKGKINHYIDQKFDGLDFLGTVPFGATPSAPFRVVSSEFVGQRLESVLLDLFTAEAQVKNTRFLNLSLLHDSFNKGVFSYKGLKTADNFRKAFYKIYPERQEFFSEDISEFIVELASNDKSLSLLGSALTSLEFADKQIGFTFSGEFNGAVEADSVVNQSTNSEEQNSALEFVLASSLIGGNKIALLLEDYYTNLLSEIGGIPALEAFYTKKTGLSTPPGDVATAFKLYQETEVPPQVRYLDLFSTNPSVLIGKEFLEKSLENLYAVYMRHYNIAEIEVLQSFDKVGNSGKIAVNKPRFVPLTEKILDRNDGEQLLCRIKKWDGVKFDNSEALSFPMLNELFIMQLPSDPVELSIQSFDITSLKKVIELQYDEEQKESSTSNKPLDESALAPPDPSVDVDDSPGGEVFEAAPIDTGVEVAAPQAQAGFLA